MHLVKYEAACRAVADAKSLDDINQIKGLADAARAAAKVARNRQLEIDAVEIRVRAERREGELIEELKKCGFGRQGARNKVTFQDLGIDGNQSAVAQRLAKLPQNRFESELSEWRCDAPTMERLTTPLQMYRNPYRAADTARARQKRGTRYIADTSDPLDRFKANDGRRLADWRAGELDRLEATFLRLAQAAEALRQSMPIANPDPLETVEMIFDQATLLNVLNQVWDAPLPEGDAGLKGEKLRASLERRSRVCEQCQKSFVMRSGADSAGRFCSRTCSGAAHRAGKRSRH